jgi:alpha-mannosidase
VSECRKIFADDCLNLENTYMSTRTFSLRLFAVVAAVALVFGFAVEASAQNNEAVRNMSTAGSKLDPAAEAVIAKLATLNRLPDGEWRMHSGDLAHGEALKLDESDWTVMAPATEQKPIGKLANDALWFRQHVVVPKTLNGYDLTGARIWFQFRAWGNGPMPEILYFNGRRVAMGDDIEQTILLDQAKPGDEVVVAIKLLHTEDQKTFAGGVFKIDFPAERPSPDALRAEFESAAYLVPSLSGNDAKQFAILNAAIEAVDTKALEAGDQKKFDASLVAARTKLEALRPLLQTTTLHLSGNSHIDAAWLWPWTETVDAVKRTYGTALQLMYEYPEYTFTQSAAQYNAWLQEKYPDMNRDINRRIKEGRWEIVGGMWVEPDLNMPDGESLVRQLLVGKRWYKQAYGVDVRIGWNPDSFGYTWQLPQIYKKSGVDYFVTQKMTWNDTNQLPFKLFWWESPDGSKVLAYFPHDYANQDLSPVRLTGDLKTARERAPGMLEMMDLYGVGDHGGGPTRSVLDEGFGWEKKKDAVLPKIEFGLAQTFFTDVEKQIAPQSPEWDYARIAKGYKAPDEVAGKVAIPTWKSELYFEYHRGVMTTQAQHKKNMRESEVEVLNAEKYSSLAWLYGAQYPGAELTEDWKKVLFNQFHDLAAGSGIGVIYKDAQKDYDWVKMSTGAISHSAQVHLIASINTESKDEKAIPILVFNTLGWERNGLVIIEMQLKSTVRLAVIDSNSGMALHSEILKHDPENGLTQIEVNVPSMPAYGYKLLTVQLGQHIVDIGGLIDPTWEKLKVMEPKSNNLEIHNDEVRIEVDKNSGCISSIIEHFSKKELETKNSCGNQLQFFKDTPKDYDAWNVDPGTLDVAPMTFDKADSVELIGEKSDHPAVRVKYHTEKSTFVQTISLEGDMVNIDNDVDWHESHVLLKAAFPLAAESDHATYEIPYGSIERPTTRTNSWDKAQFEVPAMRWADLSGKGTDGKVHGLSVINDSKYGYDATGNVLRITLLRSAKWPDPEADMGRQHFHYALYPHARTWKDAETMRRGWEYNYPLVGVVTTAHAGSLPATHSFASIDEKNMVLTAVKKAEDADALIFRAYEFEGKETVATFHIPAGATKATLTNLMEKAEGGELKIEKGTGTDVVRVPVKPYEIVTLEVEYPKN